MAVSVIQHAKGGAASQGASVPIGPIDITGATLLVASVSSVLGLPNIPTDTSSNVWLQGQSISSGSRNLTYFYKIAPATSASYTVTFTGTKRGYY